MVTMREIPASKITEAVAALCQQVNFILGADVVAALKLAEISEKSPLGKEALRQIIDNAAIAKKERLPLCQDCGTVVVFLDLGQEVHITDGDLNQAIEEGVRIGYTEGFLRKSMVTRPFSERSNTKDGTPPVIHTDIIPGNKLRIALMCKGGGAENMSRLGMLKPGDGHQGVIDFVVKVVEEAGGKACPPLIVGVGIGGTTDKVMELAKKSLLRRIGSPNPVPEVAVLENDLVQRINNLGIGPSAYGGTVTTLAVHVEVMPTHIASLPVGVNLQCHSARHGEVEL